MLAIIKYLRLHGLEKTIVDFKLKYKEYPHKVLLQYNSAESDFSHEEVRDARGLVLEKGTWQPMSFSFRKFFNYGEGYAAEIDWNNARIFKKVDGTLIHVYHDYVTKDICFGTTGTAEGEGKVDNFHSTKFDGSFSDLFVKAYCDTLSRNSPISIGDIGEGFSTQDRKNLVKAFFVKYAMYTLSFELCTPHNIVVTPHDDYSVQLLSARNMETLEEVSLDELNRIAKDLHVPVVPMLYWKSSPDKLKEKFGSMPYYEEGFVAHDGKNRVKMKNPAYCDIHFFKDSTAFWRLIDIVRSGEDNVNEYKATFPGRKEELELLNDKWKKLNDKMNKAVSSLENMIEFSEYRKHKDSITISDSISKFIMEGKISPLSSLIDKSRLNGLVYVSDVLKMSNDDLRDAGFHEGEIDTLREMTSDRGDETAVSLRRNAIPKLFALVNENGLKEHSGFFFDYLNGKKSIKKYLADYDGRELYYSLMKDFKNNKSKI